MSKTLAKLISALMAASLFGPVGCQGHRAGMAGGPLTFPPPNRGPSPIKVEILHRGYPFYQYRRHGNIYILGVKGIPYSIFIKNLTPRRIEVVVAVDGRSVISGKTVEDFSSRGYVLRPYGYVNIPGYRVDMDHIARFRFSSAKNSYARRWGTPLSEIGQIKIAVFYEKRDYPLEIARKPKRFPAAEKKLFRESGKSKKIYRRSSPQTLHRPKEFAPSPPYHSRPNLGTAYGEKSYAPARYTTFTRATKAPNYLITIYYNDCRGLRAVGIFPPQCRPRPYRGHFRRKQKRESEKNSPFAPPPPK